MELNRPCAPGISQASNRVETVVRNAHASYQRKGEGEESLSLHEAWEGNDGVLPPPLGSTTYAKCGRATRGRPRGNDSLSVRRNEKRYERSADLPRATCAASGSAPHIGASNRGGEVGILDPSTNSGRL